MDIVVTEILIAKSKSEKSFQASSMSNLKTIKIDNDATFEKEVEQFIKHLELSTTTPSYILPAFDINLSQENGSPLKVKSWEYDGNIYLYNIDEDKFYTTSHKSAFNVYKMINNITYPE